MEWQTTQAQLEIRHRTGLGKYHYSTVGCALHTGSRICHDPHHRFGAVQVGLDLGREFLGGGLQPRLDELSLIAGQARQQDLNLNAILGVTQRMLNVMDRFHLFIAGFNDLPTIVVFEPLP